MPSGQSVTEEGAVGSVSDRGRCRRVSQSETRLNLPRSPGDPPVRPHGREPAGLRWCWERGVRWCFPRPVRVNMVSARVRANNRHSYGKQDKTPGKRIIRIETKMRRKSVELINTQRPERCEMSFSPLHPQ